SSSTHARCAVVNAVSPWAATGLASSTTTFLPSEASRYAVVSPAIPLPTMHTSYSQSSARGAAARAGSSSVQREVVAAGIGAVLGEADDVLTILPQPAYRDPPRPVGQASSLSPLIQAGS